MTKDNLHKILETRDELTNVSSSLTAITAVLEMLRDTGEARPQEEQLEALLNMVIDALYRDAEALLSVNVTIWEATRQMDVGETENG